eukprot:15354019-Heterocapsa_arctica.AAC.1
MADEKAKEGAEKRGYTMQQKRDISDNVLLAEKVQGHMMRTYIVYIHKKLVRQDSESNATVRGKAA